MVLPKNIPTLEACATKNFTRVDNMFCSAELVDLFDSCNMYLQWRPIKTDHMPIISVLDIQPERTQCAKRFNFKLTDWEEFRKTLAIDLAALQLTEELTTEEEFYEQVKKLDSAIKSAIKEHVPMIKSSPYMKRWWKKEFVGLKKCKEHLARRSYRRRAADEDPIHEEFRKVWNE